MQPEQTPNTEQQQPAPPTTPAKKKSSPVANVLAIVAFVIVALAVMPRQRCNGTTRSSRLQAQERQQEVEAFVAAQANAHDVSNDQR